MTSDCAIRSDDNTLIYVMLLVHYPDLSEKELKVSRTITTTMWDFHYDVALHDEVVARELPYEYFVCREDLPPEILVNEKPCIFANGAEVHEVIESVVAKGLFQDKEIDFFYGSGDHQKVRKERVLAFAREDLYEQIENMRVKLGVYY